MVCLTCQKVVLRAVAGQCVNGDPWLEWRTVDGFNCPTRRDGRHRPVDDRALVGDPR